MGLPAYELKDKNLRRLLLRCRRLTRIGGTFAAKNFDDIGIDDKVCSPVMGMKRFAQSFLVLGMLLQWCPFSLAQEKPRACPAPESATDMKYHPGQIWAYNSRPDEHRSRLTILKIESLPKVGTIIHVRVDRVRLRNCTGGPEPDTFAHMPFSRDAFDRSVTKLIKEKSRIPDLSGYQQWRSDCGGVYTITVAEAIDVAQQTFSKSLGCHT